MPLDRNDRVTIRQYLLGHLEEELQQAIERRLLTEAGLFEELEVAEDELVDDYVFDELTPAEREQFKQYFLSTPEREQKLTFAAALHRYALKKTDDAYARARSASTGVTLGERIRLAWNSQTWLVRAVAVAAAVIVVAAVWWLARPPVNSPRNYATLTLTISNNDRAQGGVASRVTLPLQGDGLRLFLKLPETSSTATRYRVDLIRETGETKSLKPVGQDEQSVVVEVSAAQLSRGQYALNVYVIKPDGTEQRLKGSYLLTLE